MLANFSIFCLSLKSQCGSAALAFTKFVTLATFSLVLLRAVFLPRDHLCLTKFAYFHFALPCLYNLTGATNLRAGASPLLPGLTLEQHSLEQLAQAGIRRIEKIKVANLPSLGYFQGDKLEGLASLGDGQLALLNDNDFGIAAQPLPTPSNGTMPLT